MTIELQVRELSAKELDQVSGGGATYGGQLGSNGTTPGWTKSPTKPTTPTTH